MDAATYLNQARRAAGLSQRQLAAKSGIPQPAIARIERGQQTPRFDTLLRLLDACGFELRLGPKRGVDVDLTLIDASLARSPAERLRLANRHRRFLARAKRARRLDEAS